MARVLVASREQNTCATLLVYLEKIGFVADIALVQTIDMIESFANYRFVFVDLELLSGYGSGIMKTKSCCTGQPTIIGISSRGETALLMQQVEIEMADVLEMPLNFDALYESICSLCCSQDGFREIKGYRKPILRSR